jgi:hypothetical protein
LQGLYRENFNSDVNTITDVEGQMLYEEIISNEGILAELNLNGHPVFNEICLVVTKDRCLASGFDFPLLFLGRHGKRLPNQLLASRNPVADTALLPSSFPKQTLKGSIHFNGAKQKLAPHRLFFGNFGPTLGCVHVANDGLNLLPKRWLVDEKKFKAV